METKVTLIFLVYVFICHKPHIMYRITRTNFKRKGRWHTVWEGFCAVVDLGEKLTFPNGDTTGDTYKYKRDKDRLRILEGPHKGWYQLTRVTPDKPGS